MPRKYVVGPGQTAEGIIWSYTLEDYKGVWMSGDNAELRKARPDPNILMPGDRLVLPDPKPLTYHLATGKRHRIVLKVPKKELRLRVFLHKDEPLADASYTLKVDGEGKPREGTTDGDGLLKEPLRCDRAGALLQIDGRRFRLRFGYINPLPATTKESASGVSSRLANLGYESGGASRANSPALASALRLYQTDAGIETTSKLGSDTRNKLTEDFGC